MEYNYHTHTKRCNHASGTDEEYVKEAIKANLKGLGFSDHVILPYIYNTHVRADYTLKDDYLNSIRRLQKKYEGIIDIYVGFECEWDNHYAKYYKKLLDNKEVDYLIFGNHALYFKNNVEYHLKITSYNKFLKIYLNKAIKGLNSGLFKIFAHPDLFLSFGPFNENAKKVSRIICEEAKKNDVVLEINCGCINNEEKKVHYNEYRYRYPHKEFWKIAKEVGNKVVIGVDAHTPKALSSSKIQIAYDFAKELGIEVLPKLDIENTLK